MKNSLVLLLLCITLHSAAQAPYWQQKVDVTITVQLNDTAHTLDGFEKINYYNHSPDTLYYLWFHLWPNAYKNDKTAYSNQELLLGNTAFYFSSQEQRGYINRLDFKVNGSTAKTEDHPEHIDIIKLLLPAPLPPASQCAITTPFHIKLPYLFSRSGYSAGAFQVTQWYPKPAVYDANGWHPMPYLEQGEFYSEFGDYDITITLPQDYVVAATGVLQNAGENVGVKKEVRINKAASKKTYGHLKKLPATKSKMKSAASTFSNVPTLTKTLRFQQENVHDFAWLANKTFQVDADTCALSSGKIIRIQTFYKNSQHTPWKKSVQFTKEALRFYSTAIGDYPYTSVQVAESAVATGGGMEYSTFAIISPVASEKMLQVLITHEVGHNWFYGALASNERDAPWMDEGLNTFYEQMFLAQQKNTNNALKEALFQTLVKQKRDQPITTPAPDFSPANYNLVAYYKTARWLQLLEKKWGDSIFQRAMQTYFQRWQFKHPQPNDFLQSLQAVTPDTAMFALLQQKGALPAKPFSRFLVLSPALPKTVKNYILHPSQNRLLLLPAIGYNRYDKLLLGGVFTNYALPPTAFQFIAAPMYATGSKMAAGIGKISYTIYPKSGFAKIEAAVSGMVFSKRYMPDSNGAPHYERFYKAAPSVRAAFRQPAQSTKEQWMEWKTYFITEKNFSKFVTKAGDGLTYVDSLSKQAYYINQLTYNVTDYRALYPYQYQLQLQQGTAFYRINVTGDYFFNYAKGGGAGVRLFAAKFGYLTTNTAQRYATSRFQPKLLGTTGDEDYTYSFYFLGRSASYANDASVVKNSGLPAQQVALRDGAFKLRLDPFAFLQGRSDNWVAALNLTTTLPRKVVPPQLPLKLFLDIGTYAEAKENAAASSRVLYVGGLQLSLLKNVLNVYAPVVYSKVFRDNLKSLPEQNTFLKRLTFSIDLSQLFIKRITHNKFSF